MSDIPPSKNFTQFFHDDILFEIFVRLDFMSVCRCRSLSRVWKMRLNNAYFLSANQQRNEKKEITVLVQFGAPVWKMRNDWILGFLPKNGDQLHYDLPFYLSSLGWFNLIGCYNENICMRYSLTGVGSSLIVWNPLTRWARRIDDPLNNKGFHSVYIYAFGYVPNSIEYRIVHLYKKTSNEKLLKFTVYSPVYNCWRSPSVCADFIDNLDSSNVILNGFTYWINWSGLRYNNPKSLVSFSLKDLKFNQIIIPDDAKNEYKNLLVYKGNLGYLSYDYNFWTYNLVIWSIKPEVTIGFSWERIFKLYGPTISENPAFFIEEELLMVLEFNNLSRITNDSFMSKTFFNMVSPHNRNRNRINGFLWSEEVEVKHVHMHVRGIHPV